MEMMKTGEMKNTENSGRRRVVPDLYLPQIAHKEQKRQGR